MTSLILEFTINNRILFSLRAMDVTVSLLYDLYIDPR